MESEPDAGISTPYVVKKKLRKDDLLSSSESLVTPIKGKSLQRQSTEDYYLKGEFFGTDFNFIYSAEMQTEFLKNCLARNFNMLLKFEQYRGRSNNIQDEFGAFMNPNLDFDTQASTLVIDSFKNTKKYVWKGGFAFLFYFCAIYTLKDGVLPLMANTFPG